MQSGSFVNLSRQRKEQAAARALQEQQAAAAAALALSNPPLSSLQPTLDIPFNSSSSSYYGSSPSYLSHSTGSGSSSNQSSAGASPLASPPPTQGSTPSYHLSPSSAATLGGHAYSPPSSLQDHTYHASANASSNFSLVRRHHTVGSRPQKYLSATQKERLDEEDGDEGASSRTGEGEDDYDDGGSTGAVEGVESSAGSSQSHGGLIVGAAGLGLARAGSLPSKPSGSFTPSQTSSISRSSTIKRRPSLGAARLDTIPAAGSLNPTSPSPDPKSPIEPSHEDAAEWDRALAQSRKHHSDIGHDPRYAPSSNRLQAHRSLQFPPGSYQHSYPTSPPPSAPGMHQRSNSNISNISDSHLYTGAPIEPGVRRVQSLTQGPTTSSSRSNGHGGGGGAPSLVVPGGNGTRSEDLSHGSPGSTSNNLSRQNSASRLKATELPPPSSPTKHSPWTTSVIPLPPSSGSQGRSWGGAEAGEGEGQREQHPLSPTPHLGGAGWMDRNGQLEHGFGGHEYYGSHGPQGGMPLSQEEMQAAFDAMALGQSVSSSSSFAPPHLGVPGMPSHNDPHAPFLHPPTVRSHSRGSSRGPSRSQNRSPAVAPPRFASPAEGQALQDPNVSGHFQVNQGRPAGLAPGFPGAQYDNHYPAGSSASPAPNTKLSLLTDPATLGAGPQQRHPAGPASAAAYVPPIGHTNAGPQSSHPGGPLYTGGPPPRDVLAYDKPLTASGVGWDQKHAVMGGPYTLPYNNPLPMNQLLAAQAHALALSGAGFAGSPLLPQQYTQSIGSATGFLQNNGLLQPTSAADQALVSQLLPSPASAAVPNVPDLPSPVDMNALVQAKGYNPSNFDTDPPKARFFVIKSFTEDDVAKSLKFEIWSSTTFGNKRLDLAFKESAAQMPIYLFFSVNSSGHFAGMAQMLTDVDYNTTSTVWAQDGKWKGVFRLKWIYIKDVPNGALRHIRLTNTPEQKPVTNSRDTQELPFEGGIEMLKIFHSYTPRTSLLQDYLFYELQGMQKSLQQQAEAARQPTAHLPPFPGQPTPQPQRQRTSPPGTANGTGSGHNEGPRRAGHNGQQQGPQRADRGYHGPAPPQARF